jgi:hypothetical protein
MHSSSVTDHQTMIMPRISTFLLLSSPLIQMFRLNLVK